MENSKPKIKIHLWCSGFFDLKGGIEVFSLFFFKSLNGLAPELKCHVFLKHDTAKTLKYKKYDYPYAKLSGCGNYPIALRTIIFAFKLIFSGIIEQPDLIISTHIHFAKAAYWLEKVTGIPYWVIAHGVEAWNIEDELTQKVLAGAELILPVSNYTRNRLVEEQTLDETKLKVLFNTFDENKFFIKEKPKYLLERHGLINRQPIILTIGRLFSTEQYKGYDKVLLALPAIIKKIPDIVFLIGGQGDDTRRIENLISELNIDSNVIMLGFIPDQEINDYFNLCNIFVMPSKGEGFGIVYLEALACGKPTIGGNCDGAIDALKNGELGCLVNPDDIGEIATTIICILEGLYSNSLLYSPHCLRQKTIEYFGFISFSNTVENYLDEFILKQTFKEN
jgi:glycosyltransferase involved in cell wall biosynthesis